MENAMNTAGCGYVEIHVPRGFALRVKFQGNRDEARTFSPEELADLLDKDPTDLTNEKIVQVNDRKFINAIQMVRIRLEVLLKMAKKIDDYRAKRGRAKRGLL